MEIRRINHDPSGKARCADRHLAARVKRSQIGIRQTQRPERVSGESHADIQTRCMRLESKVSGDSRRASAAEKINLVRRQRHRAACRKKIVEHNARPRINDHIPRHFDVPFERHTGEVREHQIARDEKTVLKHQRPAAIEHEPVFRHEIAAENVIVRVNFRNVRAV